MGLKILLVALLFFPMFASAKVIIPNDTKFRRLIRQCAGLEKELGKTVRDFNRLARRKKVSTVTLQGNFNRIVVDVYIILEEGSRKKCERSFESVRYHRDQLFDYYDYKA